MRWRRVITVRLVPWRRATEEAACQGAVHRGGLGRYTTCVGASCASHVSRQVKRILPVEIAVGKFPCRAPQQAGPFAQCSHPTLARSACDGSSHNLSKTATKSSCWCALCEPQLRASLCLVAPGVALQRTVQQRAACLVPVFSACSPAASLHLQPQRERDIASPKRSLKHNHDRPPSCPPVAPCSSPRSSYCCAHAPNRRRPLPRPQPGCAEPWSTSTQTPCHTYPAGPSRAPISTCPCPCRSSMTSAPTSTPRRSSGRSSAPHAPDSS